MTTSISFGQFRNQAIPGGDLGAWLGEHRRGLVILPHNGQRIWWTGRVAIGIRHPTTLGRRSSAAASA
jgi:hypothetical protein